MIFKFVQIKQAGHLAESSVSVLALLGILAIVGGVVSICKAIENLTTLENRHHKEDYQNYDYTARQK